MICQSIKNTNNILFLPKQNQNMPKCQFLSSTKKKSVRICGWQTLYLQEYYFKKSIQLKCLLLNGDYYQSKV